MDRQPCQHLLQGCLLWTVQLLVEQTGDRCLPFAVAPNTAKGDVRAVVVEGDAFLTMVGGSEGDRVINKLKLEHIVPVKRGLQRQQGLARRMLVVNVEAVGRDVYLLDNLQDKLPEVVGLKEGGDVIDLPRQEGFEQPSAKALVELAKVVVDG